MDRAKSYAEFAYRTTNVTCLNEEERLFTDWHHLHRTTRDPTYDRTQNDERLLTSLYIFPYTKEYVLKNPKWRDFLPETIASDLAVFAKKLARNGCDTMILQCKDQSHVRFTIKEVTT